MRISLSDFRREISGCDRFVVSKTDTFAAVDLSAEFDRAYVCISASPHVCFATDRVQITVKHIKSISRQYGNRAGKSYIFTCLSYVTINDTRELTFKVECIDTHQKGEA